MEPLLLGFGWLLGLYLAAGAVCAVWLHGQGLRRIDSGVEGAGVFFRILITPGLIALWPLLLARARGQRRGRAILGSVHHPLEAGRTRAAHAWLVWLLILLLPLAFAAAMLARPGPAASHVESPPGRPSLLPAPTASATPDDGTPARP